MKPTTLNSVGVSTGDGVYKIPSGIHVLVIVSVMTQVDVASPTIRDYHSSRTHVLLNQSDQGVVVSVIVFTFNQEAIVASSLCPTESPLSFDSLSPVILPSSGISLGHMLAVCPTHPQCWQGTAACCLLLPRRGGISVLLIK